MCDEDLVCLPVMADLGGASPVSAHFGRAPVFLLIRGASGLVQGTLQREPGGRDHCAPWRELSAAGIRHVICRGLGRGAAERLQEAGIAVWICDGGDVATAWQNWQAGRLPPADAAALCAGHES